MQGTYHTALAASLSVGAVAPGSNDYQVLTFTLSERYTPKTVEWLKQHCQVSFIKASEAS